MNVYNYRYMLRILRVKTYYDNEENIIKKIIFF